MHAVAALRVCCSRWPGMTDDDKLRRQAACYVFKQLLLLASRLARGITGVAFGFLFSFRRGQSGSLLFLLAGDARSFGRDSFLLAPFLLDLRGLAFQPRLLPPRCEGLALGTPLGDRRIVGAGLSTEFVQKILLCLLRRFLPVGKARFLESTH